jgi:hypothetical protein
MPAAVLGDPGAARHRPELAHQSDTLVAVERHQRRFGDNAARPLAHEVRPFPLAPFVLRKQFVGCLRRLPGGIDDV